MLPTNYLFTNQIYQPLRGYLMPNPLYTYILHVYDLVWLNFMAYQPLLGYLMPNPLYTYILNIYDLVWFCVLWHINHCRLFNAKSCLHMYIKYIWFGLVGFYWHINHCRLFNAKSCLHMYIKYIWFGLVGFYGISTIVGYLMPNPLYTYISNIYDLQTYFVDNILIRSLSSFLHIVQWFQVLQYNSHNLTSVICLHK